MNDIYLYRVYTPAGSLNCFTRQSAEDYYNKNDGFLILAYTKDLFPQFHVHLERPYFSGKIWLITRKFKPCC